MSKKKTILLFSLLFLLILFVFGFFYFRSLKNNKNINAPQGRSDAEILKELESFPKMTSDIIIPYAPKKIEGLKSEEEILKEMKKLEKK